MAVPPRHLALDLDRLAELESKSGAGSMDRPKTVDQGRPVLRNRRPRGNQEIDDDVDRRSAVRRRRPPHELEFAPTFVLCVAMLLQELDEPCVLTIAKGLGVEARIDVHGTHMAHGGVVEKQPGNGSTDDDELVAEAAENLGDLDEDGPHRPDRSLLVFSRRLRLVPGLRRFYARHESTLRRK